jgi:hypothetical protein
MEEGGGGAAEHVLLVVLRVWFVFNVFGLRWRREAVKPPNISCHCFAFCFVFIVFGLRWRMEAVKPPNISCHCFAVWFVFVLLYCDGGWRRRSRRIYLVIVLVCIRCFWFVSCF